LEEALGRLAERYRRSPDQLSEQQLRDYFTYLIKEKRLASSTLRTQIFAIKFFYTKTLQKPWPTTACGIFSRRHVRTAASASGCLPSATEEEPALLTEGTPDGPVENRRRCPCCGEGTMVLVETIRRQIRAPP
jgi:hypothetical protein